MRALRLALGTLTVLPVRPPVPADRRTVDRAMVLAPLAGLAVAALVAIPAWFVVDRAGPLLTAALAVAAAAVLTRGLHLDGLADTADGLGSGRPAPEALAVMRRPDAGPFGVATLVLTLLIQVAALTTCLAAAHGAASLAVALVVSRGVLPLLAGRSFPPARADGFGQAFGGRLGPAAVTAGVLLTAALVAGIAAVGPGLLAPGTLLQPLALIPGWLLARRCRHRLGGLTGDVYGAAVELTFATSLVLSGFAGAPY